jgi:hypothetical protein
MRTTTQKRAPSTQGTALPAAVALSPVIPAIAPADVLRRLASLRVADMAGLKAQWRQLFAAEPPAGNRSFLQSRLAYRIQELTFGGLARVTVARLEALGEQLDGGNTTLRRIRRNDRPIAGTRLVREWQGVEHTVIVLSEGFDWQGRPYASLSAVARSITGTRWNGWTFFGLRTQRSGT